MIVTVEEWLNNHKELSTYDVVEFDEGGYLGVNEKALHKLMIEFAKFHCVAQQKSIINKAEIVNKAKFSGDYNPIVDEESIINAYPLTNII